MAFSSNDWYTEESIRRYNPDMDEIQGVRIKMLSYFWIYIDASFVYALTSIV